MKIRLLTAGFILLLVCMTVYSYFLIDPNITFFQHPLWTQFRNWAVFLGYYQRELSWYIYAMLVILFFIFSHILQKYQYPPVRVAAIVFFFTIVTYPFLSHDLFNYLFDARILTHYGKNPYLFTALDFPHDQWTRFMHWTHRPYPYGPTFLPLTLIPSVLGWGKFSLTFFLYKTINGLLYFVAVYLLSKKNKRSAIIFATHPLVILEGLVNSHNDMIALSLALIGVSLLADKRVIWARIVLIFSAGIKYVTAPVMALPLSHKHTRYLYFLFSAQLLLVLYLCYTLEIQPWYFLSLFVFVLYFPRIFTSSTFLSMGLLFSYYPFIRFGDWTASTVHLKREIIFVLGAIQGAYWIYAFFLKKRFLSR